MTAMRAEISQQPAALRATLDALLPRSGEAGRLAAGLRQVLLIARGTSDNAAVSCPASCSRRRWPGGVASTRTAPAG
jgi:fructoselysine-6-P-deglycase FrlB-like protein